MADDPTHPEGRSEPRISSGGDRAGEALVPLLLAENWWAVALRAALAILFGIVAFLLPVETLLALALIFAAYLLVDGVLAIVAAVRARGDERWGLLLLEGILNIAVAVIAFLFPAGAVLAFVLVTAAWAIVTGGLMLWSAFRLGQSDGRWWMALSGIASIIFGALLVIAPLVGAVVLTWWLGAYAIVFGVALLVLAWRLRKRKDTRRAGPLPA